MDNRIIYCGEGIDDIREIAKTKRIAMCHGVFDLLHRGHMTLFDFAKQYADYVIVSLVADKFVNKGPGRPIIKETERAYMLANLRSVDKVILTTEYYPFNIIELYRPDIWVHGGRTQPAPEHKLLEQLGIPVIFYEHHAYQISTTETIQMIQEIGI